MSAFDSIEALEALLQFKRSASENLNAQCRMHRARHEIPVPNPLDPTQPHLIETDTPMQSTKKNFNSNIEGSSLFAMRKRYRTPIVSVPNPLATPITESSKKSPGQNPKRPYSFISAPNLDSPPPFVRQPVSNRTGVSLPIPNQISPATHGFVVQPQTTTSSHDLAESTRDDVVRVDIVRDALKSKPQRGKKRQNLNDLERLELTRTRNREHAKCTRMKKKARHQELVAIEREYRRIKEKEELASSRRIKLVEFVESVGDATKGTKSHHIHQCGEERPSTRLQWIDKLRQLASDTIRNAEFSVIGDSAVVTTENSGFVKVSAQGTDCHSGQIKTLSGVIHADFVEATTDIRHVSLFWSAPQSSTSSAGMFPPSVSCNSVQS